MCDDINTDITNLEQDQQQLANELRLEESLLTALCTRVTIDNASLTNRDLITPNLVKSINEADSELLIAFNKQKLLGVVPNDDIINTNPYESLEVSNENMLDALRKTIDAVALIFKRIINSFKKIISKVAVYVNKTEARLVKLQTAIKSSKVTKPTARVLTEKDELIVKKAYGGVVVVGLATQSIGDHIDDAIRNVDTIIGQFREFVDELGEAEIGDESQRSNKVKSASKTLLNKLNARTNLVMAPQIEDIIKEDHEDKVVFPVFPKGNVIKCLALSNYGDLTDKDISVEDVRGIKLSVISLTIDLDDLPKMSEIYSINDISRLTKNSITSAKKLPAFAKSRYRAISKLEKDLSDLAKSQTGSTIINKLRASWANTTGNVITGMHVDSVFAYIKGINGALTVLKTHFKYYSDYSF